MRAKSRRLATILTLALAGVSTPMLGFAAGGDGKPAASASASAAAKPAEKPAEVDKDKPDAAAPKDANLRPVADDEALPPGHPPVAPEGLPPGHPPTTAKDPHAGHDDDEEDPHGKRGRFFEAPPDSAVDDPSLPPGTLVMAIKDAEDKPIPNASALLLVLESSVARGDSRRRRPVQLDEQGTLRLDGLSVGGGTSYRLSTMRGGGTFASEAFALSDKGGKRVILHAYESTSDIENALLGMQAFVFVSLKEDSLLVEHMFTVFNIGKTAYVPEQGAAKVMLPEGYKAFNTSDEMGDVKFVEGQKNDASLFGTLGPGRHEATFRYRVPLEGRDRQTIRLSLPPRVGEVRVISEAGKNMGLEVAGFPAAIKQPGRDGRKLLITARQAGQGERGIQELEFTISGLPTPGPGRWIAVLCAITALGLAAVYVVKVKDSPEAADDTRGDLLEAREALLGEFVALEKARRKGDVGPKTYDRLRRALLDALARIESRLDEVRATRSERRRHDRAARAEGGAG